MLPLFLSIISSLSILDHIFSVLSHSFLLPSLSTFLVCLPSLPIILTFIILSQNSSFTLCHDFSIFPIYPLLTFTSSCINNQNPLPHHPVNRNLLGWHLDLTISETLYIRKCEHHLVIAKQEYWDLVTRKIKPDLRDNPILKAALKIKWLKLAIWRTQNWQRNLRHFIV